jgi:hypothetical protein
MSLKIEPFEGIQLSSLYPFSLPFLVTRSASETCFGVSDNFIDLQNLPETTDPVPRGGPLLRVIRVPVSVLDVVAQLPFVCPAGGAAGHS